MKYRVQDQLFLNLLKWQKCSFNGSVGSKILKVWKMRETFAAFEKQMFV